MGIHQLADAIWGKISDSVYRVPRIDSISHALLGITHAHHHTHDGEHFTVHVNNTTANTDDHRTFIGFECPNTTKWFHFVIQVAASSAAEVFIVENVTIDDDEGTELVVLDRNRNTANTSTVLSLESTPTVGSVTWMLEAELAAANFSYVTELDHIQLAAGAGPEAIGGNARADEEWVLKQGLKYGIWIQNIGASLNLHEIHLDWYEHTSKD